MDIDTLFGVINKPKNIKSIAEETGESQSSVRNVIELGLPQVLEQVLGKSDDAAAEKVSKKSGVDTAKVTQILALVAPLVLAYLSNQKSSSTKKTSTKSDNPLMDIATSVFDKNKDGNVVDDLLGGIGGMFGKK